MKQGNMENNRAYHELYPFLKEWNIIPKVIDYEQLWDIVVNNSAHLVIKFSGLMTTKIPINSFQTKYLLKRPISVRLVLDNPHLFQRKPKHSFFKGAAEILKLSNRDKKKLLKMDPETIVYDHTDLQTINY